MKNTIGVPGLQSLVPPHWPYMEFMYLNLNRLSPDDALEVYTNADYVAECVFASLLQGWCTYYHECAAGGNVEQVDVSLSSTNYITY